MKLLIAGGTGFIGYHLAKKALKKGWIVTSISTKKPKKIRLLKKVKYIKCNLSNKIKLKKILKSNFDHVVNLAGYVNHNDKKRTYSSHYLGCKNLANELVDKDIVSFVQMGSSLEYGKNKSPHKENMKCKPISIYAKSKYLSTKYLLMLNKNKNFPSVIFRLYQSYGNKQDNNRLIPITINSCLKNLKFPCSRGDQKRDFLHIDDLIRALFLAMLKKNSKGNIFNIGSGKPMKVKFVINKIQQFIRQGQPKFGEIELRSEENTLTYPDIRKAKKILNWSPKINITKGLKAVIKGYKWWV